MDFHSDRRRFLLSTLGTAAYATPVMGLFLGSCKTTRSNPGSLLAAEDTGNGALPVSNLVPANIKTLRKSATDPTNANNIELYKKAVARMRTTEFSIGADGKPITWWAAHANIHNDACPHGNWFFLPWHRAYLYYFELVIRAFAEDDSFCLPYWDWTENPKIPQAFLDGTQKTNALNDDTRRVKDLSRVKEIKQAEIDSILDLADFAAFGGEGSDFPRPKDENSETEAWGSSGRLEGNPHNRVHATIQGNMGQFISPLDPIFWLHHCNVDRIWNEWTRRRKAKSQEPLPADPAAGSAEARLTHQYWLDFKVEGYYSVTKNGDKFAAAPAGYRVGDLVDAENMGLGYTVPVTAPTQPPQNSPVPPPATETRTPTQPTPANPAPIAVPVTKDPQLSNGVKAEIPVTATPQPAATNLGLAGSSASVLTIPSNDKLDAALRLAAEKRGNRKITLRLTARNIPMPADPEAVIEFYLNPSSDAVTDSSPEFIGSMCFFGHDHGSSRGVSVNFDLEPVIKKLVAVNRPPFGASKPLTIRAQWKQNSGANDLSVLRYTLKYLEFN